LRIRFKAVQVLSPVLSDGEIIFLYTGNTLYLTVCSSVYKNLGLFGRFCTVVVQDLTLFLVRRIFTDPYKFSYGTSEYRAHTATCHVLIDVLVLVRDHLFCHTFFTHVFCDRVLRKTKSFFRSVSTDKKERSKKSKKIQDEPSAIQNGGRECEEKNSESLAAVEMMGSKKSSSSPLKMSSIPAAAAGTEHDVPAAAAVKSSCDGKLSASTAAVSTVSAPVTAGIAGIPLRRRASKLSDSEDSSLSTDSPLKGGHIAFICWRKL
jgi:hypothetical protein